MVFMEGVNDGCIDGVDGDAENHDDHVPAQRLDGGVSVLQHMRRHLHLQQEILITI